MAALSSYVNVHASACAILLEKGYQLWEADGLIWAEREGWDFCAEDPMALLGCVAVYEHLTPRECTAYWWRRAMEMPSLPRVAANPYVPVYKRR